MAIYYGAWSYGSPSNGIRIGFDSSWSAVTNASADATLTLPVWVNNQGAFSDDQLITYGGGLTGTKAFTNNFAAASETNVHTKAYTYTYGATEYGSSPGEVIVTAAISGVYNGATPSVSVAYAIPARPYATPAAPSGVGVALTNSTTNTVSWTNNSTASGFYQSQTLQVSVNGGAWTTVTSPSGTATSYAHTGISRANSYAYRVSATNTAGTSAYGTSATVYATPAAPTSVTISRTSDTQLVASWTRNVTTAAPYTSQQVQRYDNVTAAWATFATVAGTATSYTDTTTAANRSYQYRVVAINSTGSATSTASSALQTTPAAPTSAAAAKSGSDIVLTWTRNDGSLTVTHEIYASQSGGAYALLATVGDVGTYTHASPSSAVTWTYQVRSKSTIGVTLTSGWATSNTVILATPPNAPSGLAPNGTAQNAAADIVTTWVHSSPDTAAQSAFQVGHRLAAGTWAYTGKITSGASTWTLPGGTYANGASVEFQVQTWGQATTGGSDGTGASAYSASATFATSTPPTATINSPVDASTVTTSTLTGTWGYFDAESTAQAEWQARLLDSLAAQVEFRSGVGTATTTTFDTPIADGATYTLEVRVRDASGLWSAWDSVTFSVDYLPPVDVTVSAVYDEPSGATVLTLTPDAVSPGVTVAATSVVIERSIDGGDWLTISPALAPDAVWPDMTPGTVATNSYRATVYSALPSSVVMAPVDVVVSEQKWAFLNYGPGFGSVLKFYGAHKVSSGAGIEEAVEYFAARTKPVLLSGEATSLEVAVSAILDARTDASTRDEFEAAAKTAGPKSYRDSTARRMFARMGGVQTTQSSGVITGISFPLTEIDYAG